MTASSDESLYAAYARRGDVGALSALVERHQRRLAAFLSGLLPPDDVEDAFQETWKRILEKAGAYRGGSFPSYLVTIARHVVIDRWRRRRPTVSFEALTEDGSEGECGDWADPGPDPGETCARRMTSEDVMRAVRALPEGPRQVVLMRIEGEVPFREIADILHIPIGTALTWMHVATERLRKSVGERAT